MQARMLDARCNATVARLMVLCEAEIARCGLAEEVEGKDWGMEGHFQLAPGTRRPPRVGGIRGSPAKQNPSLLPHI